MDAPDRTEAFRGRAGIRDQPPPRRRPRTQGLRSPTMMGTRRSASLHSRENSDCTVSHAEEDQGVKPSEPGTFLGRCKVEYVLHVRCPRTQTMVPATREDAEEASRYLSEVAQDSFNYSWVPSTPAIHLQGHGNYLPQPKPVIPLTTLRPGGPCDHCGAAESPQWRRGPPGKPVLCNACGTRWRRTTCLDRDGGGGKAKGRGGSARGGGGLSEGGTLTVPNTPTGKEIAAQ